VEDDITDIYTTIGTIQGQITAINTTIANLRLNNIPADGDVSFYNYKLINLQTLTLETWDDMQNNINNGMNFLSLWQFLGGEVI
jgi:hypothetical protein